MLDDRHYMRRNPAGGGVFGPSRSMTVNLLIANAVIFVLQSLAYGYPPRFPTDGLFALSIDGLTKGYVWQLITYQFMHGGLLHLLLNCWIIYVFGREVEEALGRRNFLLLYFAGGILGGLLQTIGGLVLPGHFGGAVVGASAGAFGLVAAFATLYPERPLTLLLFFIIPVSMRAKYLLLFSALIALFGIMFPGDHIAHAAHLGGMLTGLGFVHWLTQNRRSTGLWRVFESKPAAPPRAPRSERPIWRRPKPLREDELPPAEFISKEVDPILDKISAHGIQSLTERERKILEAARSKMAKR